MAQSLASVAPETLGNTLGAVFFGVVFSCILFGVSSLQVYLYFHHYPNDGLLYKCSVGLLCILDTLHISLTIFSAYHYGVLSFGDVEKLATIIWSIKLATALNVVIVLLVQSMYTYRLWLLSGYHHGVLRYLVTAIVLGGFGVGIVLAYETYTLASYTSLPRIAWAIETSFAASTAIDVLISAAMCFYLRKSKSRVPFPSRSESLEASRESGSGQLNSRISGLIQYTLSCGVFTSACSLACLFTFLLMPNNLIFLALTFILTRLYVNSYIAMMNARRRQARAPGSSGGGGLGGVSFALSTRGNTQAQTATVTFHSTHGQRGDGDPESQQSAADRKALDALDWGQPLDHEDAAENEDPGIRQPAYARHW